MDHSLVWCDDLKWFPPTRESLFDRWSSGCRSLVDQSCDDLCGTLFSDVVDLAEGHVSLACSLVDDYEQVTTLLRSNCFDNKPVLFFRLLLFLLDEFTERIAECYVLLGGKKPRQPVSISLWANRYAKHKRIFFIQHHARHVFEDGNGPMYESLFGQGERNGYCLRSGSLPEAVTVLDENWLRSNPEPEVSVANREVVPAVLVPRLSTFVDAALRFYEEFVAFAKMKPRELAKYQSPYHWPITPELEAEIKKLFLQAQDPA